MERIRLPNIKNEINVFGSNKKKRTPVGASKKVDLVIRQKAKCYWCRKPIRAGVKPHVHHKNGNPSDNRDKNLIVLCPDCHSKAHVYKERTKIDWLGFKYKKKVLVAKPIRQRKKKVVRHRKKKIQTNPFNPFPNGF